MALSNKIDVDVAGPRLEAWLASTVPGVTQVSVSGVEVAGESGLSCETVLFDARGLRDGRRWEQAFVARVAPEDGPGLFPIYDLEQEATIMRALAAHSEVPAPSVVGVEGDSEVLGGRFLVMERIAGRVPPDEPAVHGAGLGPRAHPRRSAESDRQRGGHDRRPRSGGLGGSGPRRVCGGSG